MQLTIDLQLSAQAAYELQDTEGNDAIEKLRSICSKHGGVPEADIADCKVIRRSIDARSKQVKVNLRIQYSTEGKLEDVDFPFPPNNVSNAQEVHIIGAGPAGLFAALELIQNGLKPVIFERGKAVRERRRDLAKLNKEQVVNPESNYCFGEGGAGTYSDGKLYTRSKKRGDVDKVLRALVQFGAEEGILVDAHPHIGTNKLPKLIEELREFIRSCGGEVHFERKLTDLKVESDRIKAIEINGSEWIPVKQIILATGHSARDIFQLLEKHKIQIEAKPFALGVRIEHPQSLINQIQYGDALAKYLPPASYKLVKQVENKGVYSFCMCPGGIIAPCATAPAEIVTNGWSPSRRNNPYANSGMVVEVNAKDWGKKFSGDLAAMQFQSEIEQKAFKAVNEHAELGQIAPAQRMSNFVNGGKSGSLPNASYFPGLKEHPLSEILPAFIHDSLREAFKFFGKRMKGFISDEAVVVGVESRTSSPVKIPRDRDGLNHPQMLNLYPAGEGAGYAGGIVSAAMDGMKLARAIKAEIDA
ncbi:MAG: FAD-binding protein [Flavobacteriales bacterium]|nr:FAD-binding protein [Flavobacteriales bacterium]